MLDHLPGGEDPVHCLAAAPRAARRAGARLPARSRRSTARSNELPAVSRLDAGTAELLAACRRRAGLLGRPRAAPSPRSGRPTQLESTVAPTRTSTDRQGGLRPRRRDAARRASRSTSATCRVVLLESFERSAMRTEGDPIVGVNAHAADPHYETLAEGSAPIAARRLPAHRPLGQGEDARGDLRRHHLVRRLRGGADRAPPGDLVDRRRGARRRHRPGAGALAARARSAVSRSTTRRAG